MTREQLVQHIRATESLLSSLREELQAYDAKHQPTNNIDYIWWRVSFISVDAYRKDQWLTDAFKREAYQLRASVVMMSMQSVNIHFDDTYQVKVENAVVSGQWLREHKTTDGTGTVTYYNIGGFPFYAGEFKAAWGTV